MGEFINTEMIKCYETVEFRNAAVDVAKFYEVKEQLLIWLDEKPALSEQIETIIKTLKNINSLKVQLDINNYQYFRDIVSSEIQE